MIIIPMGFARKLVRKPWVTAALVTANVLIFAYDPEFSHRSDQSFLKLYSQKVGFNSNAAWAEFKKGCEKFGLTTAGCKNFNGVYLDFVARRLDDAVTEAQIRKSPRDLQAMQFLNLQMEHIFTNPNAAELAVLHQAHAESQLFSMANLSLTAGLNSIFRHGGFWHLIGNMFVFSLIGIWLEQRLRPEIYLGFYLIAGLCGNLGLAGDYTPIVGASGAIAGVIGMSLVFFGQLSMRCLIFAPPYVWNREIYVPTWAFLIGYFLLSDIEALVAGTSDGVGHGVHLAGWITGVALALLHRQFDHTPSFCIYQGEPAKCAALADLASNPGTDPRVVISQSKTLLERNSQNVFAKEVIVRAALRLPSSTDAQPVVDEFLPQIFALGLNRFGRYRFVFESTLNRGLLESSLRQLPRPRLRKFLEWTLKANNLALADEAYRVFVSRYPKSLDAQNFFEQLRAKKGLHVISPAA